jgi:hypothetical protein
VLLVEMLRAHLGFDGGLCGLIVWVAKAGGAFLLGFFKEFIRPYWTLPLQ